MASVGAVLWVQSRAADDEPLRGTHHGWPFPQSGLPEHDIRIGDLTLHVEVAHTEGQIIIGMMGRRRVPDGTGMLFVFPRAETHAFWMKNCPIDLDVAFFGGDRKLVQLHTMTAWDVTRDKYDSGGPAQFAVETRGGYLTGQGVTVGDELHMPPAVLKLIQPDDD